MPVESLVVENRPQFNEAVLYKLIGTYQGLTIQPKEGKLILDWQALDEEAQQDLKGDVAFLLRNPNVPLENICNNWSNYRPANDSQQTLMAYAQSLIHIDDPTVAAGLIMEGQAGTGKTHMAIALAKQLMRRGHDVQYLTPETRLSLVAHDFRKRLQTERSWIFDDLNDAYNSYWDAFKAAVVAAHEHGGRIFATTNNTFAYLMEHGFVIDKGERPRFTDRCKNMLAVIKVSGESQRTRQSWIARYGPQAQSTD